MTPPAKTILEQALDLPESDRAALVGALLESLEPAHEDVEMAWKKEVADRVAALDAGEVETVPWEEVRDQLFARLSARKAG